MIKRVVLALGALIALGGLGWGGWLAVEWLADASEEDDAAPVRVTAAVERRTLEETVVTRGFTGYPEVGAVHAGGPGRVTGLTVSPGDVVEAGDVVIRIDGRPVVALQGSLRSGATWREARAVAMSRPCRRC